ncbi:MAG: GAF domain-containing protein [Burkholderiales bacterium]|nr:GAF domain-containing protein [Burkholderiales bacterium]
MNDFSVANTGEIAPIAERDLSFYLSFFKELQAVTNKIHATDNVDQIMLDLSGDICHLFDCDRLTLYAVSAGKTYIESKIKTGLHSFRDFTLPISAKSIAGYVAMTQTNVNISDVYEASELQKLSPELEFMHKVDKRTGYRTRQMLAGPLINAHNGETLGVVQLINTHSGVSFSTIMEDGLQELCETLSIAFAKRMRPAIRAKYDALVANAVLSAADLEMANRSARRKHDDIEAILLNQFQVSLSDIGRALEAYFGITYEPYREERVRPDSLLKNFKREFIEQSLWLPLEEIDDGVIVLTPAPDRVKGSRIIQNLFPNSNLIYRVTTAREFRHTVDQFFGMRHEDGTATSIATAKTPSPQALEERVGKLIQQAFAQHAQDVHIQLELTRPAAATNDGKRLGGQFAVDFDIDNS